MECGDAIDNRLFVLILQHPREKKETLATAALTVAMLRRAELGGGTVLAEFGAGTRTARRSTRAGRCSISVRYGQGRWVWNATSLLSTATAEPAADQEEMLRDLDGAISARRQLERGEVAVVAQPVAAKIAPPGARSAAAVAL